MAHVASDNIRETLKICSSMIHLARCGEEAAQDDGCLILYGELRDCAYRIREKAERERQMHLDRGMWDEGVSYPLQNSSVSRLPISEEQK